MDKGNSHSRSTAFVIVADRFSVMMAAIMYFKFGVSKNPLFFEGDVFLIEAQDVKELDVSGYQDIYVSGLSPENLKKRDFQEFLFRYRKQIRFMYLPVFISTELDILMKTLDLRFFASPYFERFLRGVPVEGLNVAGAFLALKNKKKSQEKSMRTALSETIRKSLYMAKIHDRLAKKNRRDYEKQALKDLFKVCIGKQSSNIISLTLDYDDEDLTNVSKMIADYKKLKKATKNAKKTELQHHELGKILLFEPDHDLVDRKEFFANLEHCDAVAVTALDQDPKGLILEVCLSHDKAQKMKDEDWNKIPFIQRMNGHRFLVNKEFIGVCSDSDSNYEKEN